MMRRSIVRSIIRNQQCASVQSTRLFSAERSLYKEYTKRDEKNPLRAEKTGRGEDVFGTKPDPFYLKSKQHLENMMNSNDRSRDEYNDKQPDVESTGQFPNFDKDNQRYMKKVDEATKSNLAKESPRDEDIKARDPQWKQKLSENRG